MDVGNVPELGNCSFIISAKTIILGNPKKNTFHSYICFLFIFVCSTNIYSSNKYLLSTM